MLVPSAAGARFHKTLYYIVIQLLSNIVIVIIILYVAERNTLLTRKRTLRFCPGHQEEYFFSRDIIIIKLYDAVLKYYRHTDALTMLREYCLYSLPDLFKY